MSGALRFAFLLGFAVALSGCAGIPEIPYDHTTANVHTIGLPTPSYPSGANVALASTVGQSFGLIGGLVDAAMQANRDAKFQDVLSQQKYSLPDQFSKELEATLTQRGYAVVQIPIDRKDSGLLKDMPAAPQPVDAYLDVAVWGYGYIAAGVGQDTPYRPFMSVQCKLLKASDHSVLMQDVIVLNAVNPTPQNKQITLAPNPAFQFANFDTLTTQPDKATEGLRKSVTQVVTSLGNLLQ